MQILVVGSINMDFVVEVKRFPFKGETIFGSTFSQIPGGKGANQACAIGKLGGHVGLIGVCGKDQYGDTLVNNMAESGVSVETIKRSDRNTGIAFITVEAGGDNQIIVVSGANNDLTPELISANEEDIQRSGIVLLQMEIPLETVLHTIEVAKKYKKLVILDPAPALRLPEYIYSSIDFLLPNETELDSLVEKAEYSQHEKAIHLLELGVKNVILTQGEKGVTLYNQTGKQHFPAKKVKVVDTTAAGDAFAGGFSFALSLGKDTTEAIKFANTVSGLAVTKFGAQSSLPSIGEVLDFI